MFVSLILCWAKLVCRSNTLKVWQTNLFQAINLLHFTRISTSHGITRHECRKMAHLNKSINKLFRRLDPTWWYLHFPIVAVSNQRDMSPWPRNPKFWPENCKTSGCPSSSTPPAVYNLVRATPVCRERGWILNPIVNCKNISKLSLDMPEGNWLKIELHLARIWKLMV